MRILDCEEKKGARAKFCSGTLPRFLGALEKILEKNGSTGKGFCFRNHRIVLVIKLRRILCWRQDDHC